jgi:DNA-binding response OmpR family regulator
MLRILLAGSDSRLLATRAAVLSKTGSAVIHHNVMETLDVLDRDAFDLVVLCHSLPEPDVALIVDKVHLKIPGTKILMVTSGVDQYETHPDSMVDATSVPEPERLVARAKELLQVASQASPAKAREGFSSIQVGAD